MPAFEELERQLAELTAAASRTPQAPVATAAAPQAGQRGHRPPAQQQQGGQRGAQAPAAPAGATTDASGMVMPGGPTAGDPNNPEGLPADSTDPKALLDRIKLLEEKYQYLESNVVLTDPETRVRKKTVYVDKNGVESDEPREGAKKTVTYERERVFRRNNINEKIEEPSQMRKNSTCRWV
jgi:hypothetical protein